MTHDFARLIRVKTVGASKINLTGGVDEGVAGDGGVAETLD